ncbi:MAG: permease [Myxococcales bacterium]|nr:permease [Myxococcales bacterium]
MDRLRGTLPAEPSLELPLSGEDLARCQRPVFLLPGACSRRACLLFERRLGRDGFFVWTLGVGGLSDRLRRRGIEEMAEDLRAQIDRLRAHYRLGAFALVAIGLPGLIARYYVKRLGGEQRCGALVTLGTPHHGSPHFTSGLPLGRLLSRQARQLMPMSAFIRRLKMGPFPPQVRFVSIYSRADRRHPFPCCILETDGQDNLFNLEVSAATPQEMLVRGDIYALLRREIGLGLGLPPLRARLVQNQEGADDIDPDSGVTL